MIRTRGMVSIRPTDYSGSLTIAGAFGVGVVSTEAFVAGIASIPEPFSDADWAGWFVWRSFAFRFEFDTAAANLLGSWDFEVDSKAMRKIGPNNTIVTVAESQAGAFSCFSGLRRLIKLS